jgi:hypothetical protein
MRRILIALAALLIATPALAHHVPGQQDHIWNSGYDNRGHGRHMGKPSNDTSSLVIDRNGEVRFSTRDLNVIIGWFKNDETKGQRSRSLPPGLARQLREKGQLPRGLAMKALPPGLSDRLGPVPEGYDRVILGHDVVLINTVTGAIADILRGVIKG